MHAEMFLMRVITCAAFYLNPAVGESRFPAIRAYASGENPPVPTP